MSPVPLEGIGRPRRHVAFAVREIAAANGWRSLDHCALPICCVSYPPVDSCCQVSAGPLHTGAPSACVGEVPAANPSRERVAASREATRSHRLRAFASSLPAASSGSELLELLERLAGPAGHRREWVLVDR